MKNKVLILFLVLFAGGLTGLQAQTLTDENASTMQEDVFEFSYLDSDADRRIEVPNLSGWIEVKFRNGTIGAVRARLDGKRYGFNKLSTEGTEYTYYYESRGGGKYKIAFADNVSEGGDDDPVKSQGRYDVIMTLMYDLKK